MSTNIIIHNITFGEEDQKIIVDDKTLPIYLSKIIEEFLKENLGISCETKVIENKQ